MSQSTSTNSHAIFHAGVARRWLGLGALTAILVAAGGPSVRAGDTIALVVRPAVATAPAVVRLQITVTPEAGNRAVEVAVDSPEFYRGSEFPLDGDHAPRTTTVEFRDVPAGNYDVSATLVGSGGAVRAFTERPLSVR